MLWHWGQLRGWPALTTWVVSYSLVGLGVLCKGPQPVVYFCGSVGLYLVINHQWRRLLSLGHVAGIAVGTAVVLAWAVPCAQRTSRPQTWGMIMGDTSARFYGWSWQVVTEHLVIFPLELLGSTLPWSLLLLGFLSSGLRKSLGTARPHAQFMGLATGLAFLSIWLPPDGQTRYIAPLYPCAAVLIGIVVQCCMNAGAPVPVLRGWRVFTVVVACVMTGAAALVAYASLFLAADPKWGSWAEPHPLLAITYAVAALALAFQTVRGRRGATASGCGRRSWPWRGSWCSRSPAS